MLFARSQTRLIIEILEYFLHTRGSVSSSSSACNLKNARSIDETSACRAAPSSVSSRISPFVSCKTVAAAHPATANPPNIIEGSEGCTSFNSIICGAAIPPSLAICEHVPSAALLTTVGKSSVVYTKIMLNDAVIPQRPSNAKAVCVVPCEKNQTDVKIKFHRVKNQSKFYRIEAAEQTRDPGNC